MKPGDLVKVHCDGQWRDAKLLPLPSNFIDGHCVQFGDPGQIGYKQFVSLDRVKLFVPLSDEDFEAKTAKDLPHLAQIIDKGLKTLLPDEIFEVKEQVVYGYYQAVTMEPVKIEKETIGKFIEVAGWSVTIWKPYPATREEPGGVDTVLVGEYECLGSAAKVFIQTIFQLKSKDFWNHEDDTATAAMYELAAQAQELDMGY